MSASRKNELERVTEASPEELLEAVAVEEFKNNRAVVPILFAAVAVLILMLLGMFIMPAYRAARDTGSAFGTSVGTVTGTAIGSFDGITKGLSEGYEQGKTDGINAEDVNIVLEDIKDELGEMGKLEVMVATASFKDISSIGSSYAALYLLRGRVIFTVDLNKAEFGILSDNGIMIQLPLPECEIEIDDSETEKVAEYQKHFFTGSTEAGFTGFLNTLTQIKTLSRDYIDGYEALQEQAENAAKQQVKLLAESICGSGKSVSVSFKEGK